MELDLVDPVAVAVVGVQHRLVLVGLACPRLHLLAAKSAAERMQVVGGLARTLPGERRQQHRIVGEVVTDQRRGLVGDLVRRAGRDSSSAVRGKRHASSVPFAVGSRSSFPVVRRPSRSSCARRASASG